jgi:hypothetical protein
MARITVDVTTGGWKPRAWCWARTPWRRSTRRPIQALKAEAAEILAALDSVEMDYTGSADSFRYGGAGTRAYRELGRVTRGLGGDTGSSG